MNTRDDGGPAYPIPIAGCTDGGVYNTLDQSQGTLGGMSLRDWFAGMAMQGLLANPESVNARTADEAARCAFDLADAMIAERAK